MVDACFRIRYVQQPAWFALENPVGTLVRYLGPPVMMFDPADYGDPYTKKTLLWGSFTCPPKVRRVPATDGSRMHRLPPSADRWRLRAATPAALTAGDKIADARWRLGRGPATRIGQRRRAQNRKAGYASGKASGD